MTKKDDQESEFGAALVRREIRGVERKPVEVWAHEKGMLPEIIPAPPAPKGHIPEAPRHNPKYSEFAAAKAGSRWPIGAELTESEFDAAVEKFYGPANVMR